MSEFVYLIEFEGDRIKIWKREPRVPDRHRFLDSEWSKDDLIGVSKTGIREKRNAAIVYMADGTQFEIVRSSVKRIEQECGLERNDASCAVKISAVDRMRFKGRNLVALGLINHLCLFPVCMRFHKSIQGYKQKNQKKDRVTVYPTLTNQTSIQF